MTFTLVEGTLRSLDQTRIVRKTQVVVGAEIQHRTACNLDFSTLGRANHSLGFVETRSLDSVELGLQVRLHILIHSDDVLDFFVKKRINCNKNTILFWKLVTFVKDCK